MHNRNWPGVGGCGYIYEKIDAITREGGFFMRGRKMKYQTPDEMEIAINAYFDGLMGPMMDKSGNFVFKSDGTPYMVQTKPATVTGLALFLGLTSRQALLNYQARDGFRPIIERAKMRVQAYCEERLFDRDGVNGAKFSLQNNFGWQDKKDLGLDANDKFQVNIHVVD